MPSFSDYSAWAKAAHAMDLSIDEDNINYERDSAVSKTGQELGYWRESRRHGWLTDINEPTCSSIL